MKRRRGRVAIAVALLAGLWASAGAADRPARITIRGTVTDGKASLAGVSVTATRASEVIATASSAGDGSYSLTLPPGPRVTLTFERSGYDRYRKSVDATGDIVLNVALAAGGLEVLSVDEARAASRGVAGGRTTLDADALAVAPPLALDDVLRESPSFSLFRRSGSRWANPTTQGVTLRGLGATGASRALVLDDGVPVNDPLGGWVYWSRIPRLDVQNVDLVRGAAATRYGTPALGGAIDVWRYRADRSRAVADISAGRLGLVDAAFAATQAAGDWGVTIAGERFTTDGFVLVEPDTRGAVDVPAATSHTTLDLSVVRRFAQGRVDIRFNHFDEQRNNGTPLQRNSTGSRQLSLGGDWSIGANVLRARLYDLDQDYDQTFSSIAAGRATERLTQKQVVPSQARGVRASWGRPLSVGDVEVGVDLRLVEARSQELSFGPPRRFTDWRGKQRDLTVVADYNVGLWSPCRMSIGVRLDAWANLDPRSTTAVNGGPPAANDVEGRSQRVVDPHATLRCGFGDGVSFEASAFKSLRAPTLNELYRSFRAGNTLTQANARLGAERLTGGEASVGWRGGAQRWFATRATAFWSEVDDPISNVTLSVTPQLITRQRRNIGQLRARGVEWEAEADLGAGWNLAGGYLYADSTVTENPADRTLEGNRVPQVPRHTVTAQVRWQGTAGTLVSLSGRAVSAAFDDDLNELELRRYATLDALISQDISPHFAVYLAGENLTDREVDTGRTPVRTIGSPRVVRFGVRLKSLP